MKRLCSIIITKIKLLHIRSLRINESRKLVWMSVHLQTTKNLNCILFWRARILACRGRTKACVLYCCMTTINADQQVTAKRGNWTKCCMWGKHKSDFWSTWLGSFSSTYLHMLEKTRATCIFLGVEKFFINLFMCRWKFEAKLINLVTLK